MRGALLALVLAAAPGASAHLPSGTVLPPGQEERILRLCGASGQDAPLPGGWQLGDVAIEASAIRCDLRRAGARVTLVLEQPDATHTVVTRSFGLRLEDPSAALDAGDRAALLAALGAAVRAGDVGAPFWVPPPGRSAAWYPNRAPTLPPRLSAWPASPTVVLQVALLAGLALLLVQGRRLWALARRVPGGEWLAVLLLTGLALGLRLIGGSRVPGHVNGHGYDLLRHVLFHPPTGLDVHGNGMYALHGVLLAVLPRGGASVVGVHVALSVLTVPLTWLVSRVWLGQPRAALAAAAVTAALPIACFYAATEVRLVPGAALLLLVLALLGWAVYRPAPLPLLAAALFGAVTVQLQPFLLLLPAVGLLLLLARPGWRAVLASGWVWAVMALFVLLWLEPALLALADMAGDTGPAPLVPRALARAYLLVVPGGGNVLLDPAFTPPLVAALVLLGVITGARSGDHRWPTLVVLTGALLLTLPGMVPARMNPARLQLAAQPLYAVLAGAGLAWLLGRVPPGMPGRRAVQAGLGVILLGGSLALWPGPLGQRFTPQLEREFLARHLDRIPDDCAVFWPLRVAGALPRLPTYLSLERGARHTWAGLSAPELLDELGPGCRVYYRPTACYDLDGLDPAPPDGLRPECAAFERRLVLSPLAEAALPARPDSTERYSRARLPVGLYRVASGQRP